METIEYRCVLLPQHSQGVFASAEAGGYRLPRVQVPRACRPVREAQEAARTMWGVHLFVLETWTEPGGLRACALANVLTTQRPASFHVVQLEELTTGELLEEESRRLKLLLESESRNLLLRLDWLDEAIAWIESVTGHTFRSTEIEQWNAGSGFSLFRATAEDGRQFWLKATGAPNTHEFRVTRLLSDLYPALLPKMIATHEQWNAWLTEHAGDPLETPPRRGKLASAAKTLAEFQRICCGRIEGFLAAGAFDQRVQALQDHINRVISFLIEAMGRQTSTKVAPLSLARLLELGEILHAACARLRELEIPDTVLHNDLNARNILWDGTKCVFTDWCETAIGNPFLSCERLCQLDRAQEEEVRNIYRERWSTRLSKERIDNAIALSPLLAVYACLYGRGDWLDDTDKIRPGFESYARSLARHMDRAARNPVLLERLCR